MTLQRQGDDLILSLRVIPRASRDEIVGWLDDGRLRVRITAPPVDGKANRHLLGFLAKAFGVARRDVELLAGLSGRDKRVRIRAPKRLPAILDTPS